MLYAYYYRPILGCFRLCACAARSEFFFGFFGSKKCGGGVWLVLRLLLRAAVTQMVVYRTVHIKPHSIYIYQRKHQR